MQEQPEKKEAYQILPSLLSGRTKFHSSRDKNVRNEKTETFNSNHEFEWSGEN